ncbi:MAG: glucose-1-phosphate thymidylyltransferase [Bacteroidetes bacterium]|nr:glucose-1-phosphate thymidylyltransferase [Bacteroidota bacterium]
MNPIELNDHLSEDTLYPFTLTRSVLDLRIGILTLREKWALMSGQEIVVNHDKENGGLPANIIPSIGLIENIKKGKWDFANEKRLTHSWQIFQLTDETIRSDFDLLTENRKSHPVSNTNHLISPASIFIEEGVKMEYVILNASTGPIYISKNSEIMEGSIVRGPFFLGEGSVLKMGTKVYGATSIGKKCVVGGEIKNSVFFDYSNKAHDGYIGDSVIGAWCNLGAGTSNSNLKNTAGIVKAWSQHDYGYLAVGAKCGLLLGDYSRSAINTSFNTGTVTGICCNIFGSGLSPKHIPSFSWGYPVFGKYQVEKAIVDIANWKKLKNELLTDREIQVLKHIFEKF